MQHSLKMKLKERVILTLALSISILFIFHIKSSQKKNLDQSPTEEVDDEKENDVQSLFDLDGIHSHRKRETIKKKHSVDLIAVNKENNERLEKLVNDKAEEKSRTENSKESEENGVKEHLSRSEDSLEDANDNLPKIDPWDKWWTMVEERHVTRPGDDESINEILHALAMNKIVSASVGAKGTQLKAFLKLDGSSHQKVVFKPMRYPRDHIIEGKIYDGFDRHNGEIAAFHLDRILGFNRAPPVVGRRVNLKEEFKPVTENRLLKTFFTNDNGDECFFGVCYYCKKAEAACANGNMMEGSVTIWLPHGWDLGKMRHPWQRTYNKRKARWELDQNYCQDVITVSPYDAGPRLLDIMDTAIFDFLIGNGDRHHYETFKKGGAHGMLLHLDNGKSFGNPNSDELSILAPIMQCCSLRKSTYERLKKIPTDEKSPNSLGSRLRSSLLSDPISPVMSEPHFKALNRRLGTAMNILKNCIELNGLNNVIKDDGL